MVKKFAIFVATTGGPIQIERLTEERAPQSMICISGSTTILPISTEYNDFVRRGSGVIERDLNLTDKVSFRADVSGMIDAGKSWQLGFFLAHAVTASTKAALVTNLNDADYVIWATGCVDYDLNILKVDHLSEKLRTSLALFEQLEKKKTPITIIFPGNQRENISDVRSFANTAEIHAADDLRSLLELLNLDVISEPTKTHKSDDNFEPNSRPKLQTLLVSIAIFISLFTIWFFTESSTPEFSKLKPPQILDEIREDVTIKPKAVKIEIKPIKPSLNLTNNMNVKLFALSPPVGKGCNSVLFSGIEPSKLQIPYDKALIAKEQKLKKVCRLLFEFSPLKNKYFAAILKRHSGRYITMQRKPKALTGSEFFNLRQSWTIELPRKMSEPFHYSLITLSSNKPLHNDLKWLKKQANPLKAKKKLAENGVQASTFSLKVNP